MRYGVGGMFILDIVYIYEKLKFLYINRVSIKTYPTPYTPNTPLYPIQDFI
jgi:hypothetical protein